MLFQCRRKEQEVQGQLVKLLNQNCNEVQSLMDGPRGEGRVNLTIAVYVVPWNHKRPSVELAVAATTRELSTAGLSLVVDRPVTCENVAIGWTFEGSMHFAKGKFRHQDPLGAGFWNVGVKMLEMLALDEWPELQSLQI